MVYSIVQRESDSNKKFYTATKDTGEYYEVPCVLDEEGEVNTSATESNMEAHIVVADIFLSYL